MAFDKHLNFAYSTVATAPSPATSGTSLIVASGQGALFPTPPFNATVWPAGAQPLTTNSEIVRVTNISTDTLTITRGATSGGGLNGEPNNQNRSIIIGDNIAAGITVKTITDIENTVANEVFNFIAAGCVWTADSPGSTLNASMTAGTVVIAGVTLTVAAITAHAFTASKDTYIDFQDNGDGTASVTYSAVTNNAASPALGNSGTTANTARNAIIVAGASNITSTAASINQGQETKVLPIASSIPYSVTDSLGNLICPRDPNSKLLGYRQQVANQTITSSTAVQITALSCPVIVPANRKVKITVNIPNFTETGAGSLIASIWDGTVGSGTQLNSSTQSQGGSGFTGDPIATALTTPATSSKTYNGGGSNTSAVGSTINASSTVIAFIMVELS